MEKQIIHDRIFLARASTAANEDDISTADDLIDTLKANSDRCVGLAANMIGVSKRIIVFSDNGLISEMFNPEIIGTKLPFDAEEGCLSLDGIRKVRRYRSVKVRWQTRNFQTRIKTFTGFTAQIIQHEIDHTNGILV